MPVDFDLDRPFQAELDLLEEERGEFLLSFDKDRLQLDRVEEFLVKGCYWASDRSRAVIETSIRNSVCLGIYRNGLQVAFARLVTDRATFAWLCDVYVEDAQRGQALGKWLVESACRYTDRLGIGMTILATRDAHGLYAGYGHFRPLDVPDKWMRRDLPKKD
jgi:GNAT superfamily N-acetyltransferase